VKRILFVDDESKVLDGIGRMLHADRKRWDMQFVTSGEDALRACEAGAFDVVISDMRMPGMDGAKLLSHVRDRYPGTARIILSGYSEVSSSTRAVPVAHRFLTKPCDAAQLQAAIDASAPCRTFSAHRKFDVSLAPSVSCPPCPLPTPPWLRRCATRTPP